MQIPMLEMFFFKSRYIIFLKDIPLSIRIGTKELSFICATLHVKNHFRSIFRLNDRFYTYDDLSNVKFFEKKIAFIL